MSTGSAAPPITIEQFLSFKAPPGFRDELIEGKIVLSPDPKALHQEVAHRICTILDRLLLGSLFIARQRTNMQMPQDHSMPSPDVFVIDAVRWNAAIAQNGYPQQSPQLVVEVISRSNTKAHVARKTALYLRNGAEAVWIIYPLKKIMHVSSAGSAKTLTVGDTLTLPPPLPAASIPLQDIFDFESAFMSR